MSTTALRGGQVSPAATAAPFEDDAVLSARGPGEALGLGVAFGGTVLCHLAWVLPQVTSELARWRTRALRIPNPKLRHHALQALCKRGNIEGAALFATLAPAAQRRRTITALVAYQSTYNYLDALSELPSDDPIANGEQLHEALLTALAPGAEHPDYYRYNLDNGDGGYLNASVDACREALARLPSFEAVAPVAREAAARIVDFQALNLNEAQGGHRALKAWARETTPPDSGLRWWEAAAAAGSSLAVHALIATAARAHVDTADARQIARAYFPWVGALHSLLDSLVDRNEDHQRGQPSLLSYYTSRSQSTVELARTAGHALRATERLEDRHSHRAILTAMCSYYLSAPQCATAEGQTVTRSLTEVLGVPLSVAIALFRLKRLAGSLRHQNYT